MFSFWKQLFNTETRSVELLDTVKPKKVSMYSCGPTVYHYAHLGNLRSYVFSDILKRTLMYLGYDVSQVINITDVGHLVSDADDGEDKVEKGARREGKTVKEIISFYTDAFFEDIKALNIDTHGTKFPRATEYIEEQINLIKKLEEKGHTYITTDGVYFDTSTFPEYGKLGGIDTEGMREGARVEKNTEKRNPTDFALWKFSGKQKRLQEWESPWGTGFPGWHIECSAMAMKILGEEIDIHTGGIDHIPIHHNNEIAQSEAATDHTFARIWMHNEFLTTANEKMAKSAENFLRLENLKEKQIHPLAYRYFLLQGQYRSPLSFSWEAVESSETALKRLANIVQNFPNRGSIEDTYKQEFSDLIARDLDTPQALALIWKLLKDDSVRDADKKATILDFDRVFGLSLNSITFSSKEASTVPDNVQQLAQDRESARIAQNWDKADELREKIRAAGYIVKDTDNGPVVEPE